MIAGVDASFAVPEVIFATVSREGCGRHDGRVHAHADLGKWQQHLAPGERAVVMIIAADRRQARVILRYVKGIIQASPMLKSLLEVERRKVFGPQ